MEIRLHNSTTMFMNVYTQHLSVINHIQEKDRQHAAYVFVR